MSDVVLKIMSKENTYTSAIQGKWLSDQIVLSKVSYKEVLTPIYAFDARILHRQINGLDPIINQDNPQRNFRDAMKALDTNTWAAAYNSKYIGLQQREIFKVVKSGPGVESTTR